MENKDKRNGKQQNNQASDREKKVLIDKQYVETAAQMERELFADRDFEDYEPEDSEAEARSYEVLINRLKREGVYREEFADMAEFPGIEDVDAERFSDIKASQPSSSGRKKYGRVQVGKVAGIALLCCACIFATSMTSEANRNYLVNNIRVWSGNDTKTVVGNSDQNENVDTAEYEAVEEIEKQLGVEMPEFYYRPNGFEFVSYEVNQFADIAFIEYKYEENIILFYIDKQSRDTASQTESLNGTRELIKSINVGENKISIEKNKEPGDKIPSYTASWKQDNVFFNISGKIEKNELIKIIKNIVY